MLSRRWLINAALLVLIASLVTAGRLLKEEPTEASGQQLISLELSEVSRIEIRVGDSPIVLQRRNDRWRITAPVEWSAQTANVDRLMTLLKVETSPVGKLDEIDPAALGLAPALASVAFNGHWLYFGVTNNIGGRRYVQYQDDLYLVPDTHLAFATQGLPGLVDRQLIPDDLGIVSFELPDGRVEQDADGSWQLHPTGSAVRPLPDFDNWRRRSATSIRPADSSATAIARLPLKLGDDESLDLALMSTEPEIIIANPQNGLQYHYPRDYFVSLLASE